MSTGMSALSALVVDDCVHMRRIVLALLRGFGVRDCRECGDGMEALAEVRARAPDFIICDYRMPNLDGIELARRLRQERGTGAPKDIPLILMTGYSERPRVEEARDAGVTEIIAKPLTSRALMQRVVEICDRPRPFILSRAYVGPDRRRRRRPDYAGPYRRSEDGVAWEALEFADD